MNNWISRRHMALLGAAVHGRPPHCFGQQQPSFADDVVLKVYTALEEEQLPVYKEAFEKANPGIVIEWQRELNRRYLRAPFGREAKSPSRCRLGPCRHQPDGPRQGGHAGAAIARPASIRSKTTSRISRNGWPTWVGMDAWASAICFNTVEAEKLGLPKPDQLEGPDQSRLQGPDRHAESRLVGHRLPDGVGLAAAVWQWRRLELRDGAQRQHQNLSAFRLEAAAKAVGAGEYPIGISFAYPGVKLINDGAPVEVILPKEGIGWDMGATAIMKGTSSWRRPRSWPTSRPAPMPTSSTMRAIRCWPART